VSLKIDRSSTKHVDATLDKGLQGLRRSPQQHYGGPASQVPDADPWGQQHLRGGGQSTGDTAPADPQQPDIGEGRVRESRGALERRLRGGRQSQEQPEAPAAGRPSRLAGVELEPLRELPPRW
jgi:hypothetical protein